MTAIFLKLVDISLTVNWMILAVLVLRFILRKAPKWIYVLLWGIVAIRLICPVSIESAISLVPKSIGSGDMVSQWSEHYIEEVDIHTEGSFYYEAAKGAGRTPIADESGDYYVVTKQDQLGEPDTVKNTVVPVLAVIWAVGVAGLACYTIISYWCLHKRIGDAVRYREGIYQSEYVSSPFVLGVIRPRIYLPYDVDGKYLEHVVAHEQAHIHRRDHLWKPLGFGLLTIYWFNPLMWLAYVLLCRDIELACDERVIKVLGREQRADYTQALVSCSVNHRVVSACPLAFGEVGVKERVKSIMKYKKPRFWIIVLAIVSCFLLAACFLTNPMEEDVQDTDGLSVEEPEDDLSGEESDEESSDLETDGMDKEISAQDKMVADISYQLELSTLGKEFRDMDEIYKKQILEEYGSLLDGYTFVARESVDGEAAYILGSYEGELAENPLHDMTSLERWEGDRGYQLIYEMPDKEIMWEDGYQEKGIEIEDSRMTQYDDDYKIILIQPVTVKISLHDAMAGYFWRGSDYIPDAVSRGIAVHIPTEPYLSVYFISEKYGETTENIPLTESEVKAIMQEERISLPEGYGLSASLNMNGESEFYSEANGVPQTIIDLAVERCGYKFETPKDITDDIIEARLDWLDQPLYLAEEKLGRLQEILTEAEFGFVGGCGYSAKLTITLENGAQMVMFKGCDSCDTIVFGSYGGYFLGDTENKEFWEMFGLDAETHGLF